MVKELNFISIQATHNKKKLWFDARGRIGSLGRYINHAAKGANLLLRPPVYARGRLRIGFVAKKEIQPGEEVFWDYHFR